MNYIKAAPLPVEDSAADSMRLFCTFRLDERLFGLDLLDVKEVNTETTFTPLPHAPPSVIGYVNLRGHVFLALDLRLLLGMSPTEITANSRLIIFKPAAGDSFGVIVDQLEDVARVPFDKIEDRRRKDANRPQGEERRSSRSDIIAGVCKLDSELLMVVNPRGLLKIIERELA